MSLHVIRPCTTAQPASHLSWLCRELDTKAFGILLAVLPSALSWSPMCAALFCGVPVRHVYMVHTQQHRMISTTPSTAVTTHKRHTTTSKQHPMVFDSAQQHPTAHSGMQRYPTTQQRDLVLEIGTNRCVASVSTEEAQSSIVGFVALGLQRECVGCNA